MAFSRSLSRRATLIARRYQPSFAYIFHDDDRKSHPLNESQSQQKPGNLGQQRSFGTGFSNSSSGFGVLFQDRRCSQLAFLPGTGISFGRYMSTMASDGAKEVELMTDVAEAFKDTAIEAVSQVPAVNEVAIAAADCWLPVATLQYVIDAVHSFTGFNWWASIVVTTLLIRGSTLPLLINQLKATTKMTLMRPHLEEIKERMSSQGNDSLSMADGQNEMKKLFKEYGVTPFTPLKGLFIQGPIFVSFFLAISTMAEKMPSFKYGGAYWFTDLSTPDSLYIFPALTALTFLITVECNMQEGMEGNPAAKTMKNVSRVLAALTVPFTMSFPKAIFCYWITSNLFSLTYGLVLKAPGVKKALGVPEIPPQPAVTTPRPSIDLYTALKQTLKQAKTVSQQSTSLPVEPTKASNQRTTSSSSSTINQRLRNLEKQVKGRKKNKKR
ncbi:Mitochondrial inner membrane protein OXA1 [Hibiscus syriacus]|uniref:Mitochondrial inner membrane protein OXA1 n=1 Tax=Hibiscus syriacus TaxID=106335 RepID=A0A6A3BAV6_HIBSY|nr:mitochondrial inner membrane protein OXA1-like [Hibiscus syriacus]KAE8712788.1 Mitochondrial inner membrane protein OXA1 [Hibiscus syriacus]